MQFADTLLRLGMLGNVGQCLCPIQSSVAMAQVLGTSIGHSRARCSCKWLCGTAVARSDRTTSNLLFESTVHAPMQHQVLPG